MTREELEKAVQNLFKDIISTYNVDLPLHNEVFERFGLECAKLGIRYGINKICEEYIDENGMCLGKYKSPEEVIKELDEEQDDKR